MQKSTFLVGRRTRRSTLVVYVKTAPQSPIVGPWTVEAVVSSN